jgi:hypothetical protein
LPTLACARAARDGGLLATIDQAETLFLAASQHAFRFRFAAGRLMID